MASATFPARQYHDTFTVYLNGSRVGPEYAYLSGALHDARNHVRDSDKPCPSAVILCGTKAVAVVVDDANGVHVIDA